MILYLHGFQSSPNSFKAQLIEGKLKRLKRQNEYICPQLSSSPEKSIELALKSARQYSSKPIAVIGSSLGGYYANWIAEELECRAVLLNPVIDPWKIRILGDSPDRSDLRVREWLEFTETYEKELESIRVTKITRPDRYMLIAATGDQLLDWKMMQMHYEGAKQIIIDGSDHGLSDFEQYIDDVLSFCGIGDPGQIKNECQNKKLNHRIER